MTIAIESLQKVKFAEMGVSVVIEVHTQKFLSAF